MNEHQTIWKTVQYRLARAAAWRREQAVRFPDDFRNHRAADHLERLARLPTERVSGETKRALAGSPSSSLPAAVSAAARDVEFRSWPEDINDFAELIVEKLSAHRLH